MKPSKSLTSRMSSKEHSGGTDTRATPASTSFLISTLKNVRNGFTTLFHSLTKMYGDAAVGWVIQQEKRAREDDKYKMYSTG